MFLLTRNARGDVRGAPVCNDCYNKAEPRLVNGRIEFRQKKRVSHVGYILWRVESRSIARLIERVGRTVVGRLMARPQ